MSRRSLRLALSLYPRRWRTRYGRELDQLIRELRAGHDRSWIRIALDLVRGGLSERAMSNLVTAVCIVFLGGLATGAIAYRLTASRNAPTVVARGAERTVQPGVVLAHDPENGRFMVVSKEQIVVRLNPKNNHIESIVRRRG